VIDILRLAVLSSTRATDMNAILDAITNGDLDAEIAVVASNKQCPALERAEKFGLPGVHIDPLGKSQEQFDTELLKVLAAHKVDLVLLIGYMKILTPAFISAYEYRIMNVHPSLLPAFAGMMDKSVYERVLETNTKTTGATLHFVDDSLDDGPIIMQREIEVEDGETVDSLKKKTQSVEQEMLVKAVRLYGEGKISVTDGNVIIGD
jgi:phosphoribosylglycinamide formyltransferase 1